MEQILKPNVRSLEERSSLIKHLLTKFEKTNCIKYCLNDTSYLILSKDERQVRKIRRYHDSPLPLLSSLDVFKTSSGDWNNELAEFGIKARAKYGENPSNSVVGSQIYLIHYDTVSLLGNKYLKRQYKRLTKYRSQRDIVSYWTTSWNLMCHSWSFRLASLNSWHPRWYKELDLYSLKKLWEGLHKILSLEELETTLKNVWIESPKGKWRQLCIPNKSWRLYLHMLNNFISYIYNPELPSTDYDGFIYNRGALSWWTGVLWGPYLNTYMNILEVDMSSAFSNLNCRKLGLILQEQGLIPLNMINMILTHLQSPCIESSFFPTLSSYIEHKYNNLWRKSSRNLPMGLGISPILFVITLNYAFESLDLKKLGIVYRAYADDLSFFFNIKGVIRFINEHWKGWKWLITQLIYRKNILIEILNSSSTFKQCGLKICTRKSGLVRLFSIWLKPYVSLGLRLSSSLTLWEQILYKFTFRSIPLDLSGWTRGRGANPSKGKPSTLPSRQKLDYINIKTLEKLDFVNLLKKYGKYFGLLQAKLYSTTSFKPPVCKELKSVKKSPLRKLLHYMRSSPQIKKRLNLHINLYNAGGKLNEIYLEIQSREGLSMKWQLLAPNLEREFKIQWPRLKSNPCYDKIVNPLKEVTTAELEQRDLFNKYSEIVLTPSELKEYEYEYSKVKHSPDKEV